MKGFFFSESNTAIIPSQILLYSEPPYKEITMMCLYFKPYCCYMLNVKRKKMLIDC